MRLDSLNNFRNGFAVVGVNQIQIESFLAEFRFGSLQKLLRGSGVKAHEVGELFLVFSEKFSCFGIGRELDGNGGVSCLRAAHDVIVDEGFAVNGVGNCEAQIDVAECARVMILRVLIEREVIQIAGSERVQIFGKFSVLLDVLNLVALNVDNLHCAVLEGSQRVIGGGNDLIIEIRQ